MKSILKLALYGLVIWIVPFITGFFFYSETGELTANIFLFKSVMLLTLAIVTITLSFLLLKKEKENFFNKSVNAGLLWFLIPIVLDILILIPMAGMGMQDYIFQIGLRYLLVPMISISNGWVLSAVKTA